MDNTNGATAILPLLRWLDSMIDQYGAEIYIIIVNLSPLLIAWIVTCGAILRRWPRRRRIPPILRERSLSSAIPPRLAAQPRCFEADEEDSQSFAA